MATFVADCPRCGANKMTFDVLSDVHTATFSDWQHWHEITCKCRHCKHPSLLLVPLDAIKLKGLFGKDGSVSSQDGDVGKMFKLRRVITVADLAQKDAPKHLPSNIAEAFSEGTKCLAIGCFNAAAAMFRLCLDLATKSMLPDPDITDGPTKRERYSLGHRLEWLFKHQHLPSDLEDLSTAVKEDGNAGAHDGKLEVTDADDLYDFTFALLERLYTQPARLAEAKARRESRRSAALEKAKAAKPSE